MSAAISAKASRATMAIRGRLSTTSSLPAAAARMGRSAPASASRRPAGVPTAPTNVSASALSGTQIALTWANTNNTQTSIEIDRKTGGGTYTVAATVPGDHVGFVDSTLSVNTTYTYRISTSNVSGTSDWT